MDSLRVPTQALTGGVQTAHLGEDGITREQLYLGDDNTIALVLHDYAGLNTVQIRMEGSYDGMEVAPADSEWVAIGEWARNDGDNRLGFVVSELMIDAALPRVEVRQFMDYVKFRICVTETGTPAGSGMTIKYTTKKV